MIRCLAVFVFLLNLSGSVYADSLVFSIIPSSTTKSLLYKWTPFVSFLSKETGIDVSLEFVSSYSELLDNVLEEKTDFFLLGSLVLVQALAEVELEIIAQRCRENTGYYSIIAVHKDSPYFSLNDLQGKAIAFTDELSTSGYLLPRILLAEKNIFDIKGFFSKIIWARNHDNSIILVANHAVDAACFSSTRWNNYNASLQGKKQGLRILSQSESFPLGPICCRKNLNSEIKRRLKEVILTIDIDNSKTAQIAEKLKLKRFVKGSLSNYEQVKKYYTLLNKIKGNI